MQEIWQRYLQLKRFFKLSWSQQSMEVLKNMTTIDPRLGSQTFKKLWTIEKKHSSSKQLLKLIVSLLDFPELTGDMAQTRHLLSLISPSLAPDDSLWWDIAEQVDKAFPGDSLAQEGKLARQVHQLRYLISCYQAEYVRQHFRHGKMTDAESLAKYLSRRTYDLTESARLHNKITIRNGKPHYPDGKMSYNIKILQRFHTEFILNSSGRFLNEIDPEIMTEAGVVNGASFNYATQNNQRHWELDVLPISKHDPDFRHKARKAFVAPSLIAYRQWRGYFAKQGRPCFYWVNKELKSFSKMLKKV
ncbi:MULTISPECIES: DUF3114 domain-containing protein [Streptococcus]|uniref:DUF3114 domain-containing protein n=1 Tax=Streptococcus caledonicus TaxID=2614158 RepID=A0ABW0UCR8_9STRE|nr:DUF3114 domain-containing protein [Streptococcus sp. S784/96/1]